MLADVPVVHANVVRVFCCTHAHIIITCSSLSSMDYFGPVVNRSARVADSGHGGQIVCTHEVRDALVSAIESGEFRKRVMIADLGIFPYKGISEPVRVFQITSEDLVGRNPFPTLRVEKAEKSEKKAVNKVRASGMHLSLPAVDAPEFSMTVNSVTHARNGRHKHTKRASASEGSSHGEGDGEHERKGEFSEMSVNSQYDSEDR